MTPLQMKRMGLLVLVCSLVVAILLASPLDAQDAGTAVVPSKEASATLEGLGCAKSTASPSAQSQPAAKLTVDGLTFIDYGDQDSVTAGIWQLPYGASISIPNGMSALVRLSDGSVRIGPCQGTGFLDFVEGDSQTTTINAGDYEEFSSPARIYLLLDESSGVFQITGLSADSDALIWIEIWNAAEGDIVCDAARCWGSQDATPLAADIATPGGGCFGVRCWTK